MDLHRAEPFQSGREHAGRRRTNAPCRSHERGVARTAAEGGRTRHRVGARLHRFEASRHHNRSKRSKRGTSRPESACGQSEILCGKHQVHHAETMGWGKLRAVHASRKVHNDARGHPGAFRRGAKFAAELRITACARPGLCYRVLEDAPSICIRKWRRRQELKGRFRRDETQFIRLYTNRIALGVGQALVIPAPASGCLSRCCRASVQDRQECLSYWATTSSMGVSLVTLAPRSGVCSMTVPFGHSPEEAKVVFAIFNPPVEIRRSASGSCMPTRQGMI